MQYRMSCLRWRLGFSGGLSEALSGAPHSTMGPSARSEFPHLLGSQPCAEFVSPHLVIPFSPQIYKAP